MVTNSSIKSTSFFKEFFSEFVKLSTKFCKRSSAADLNEATLILKHSVIINYIIKI